MRFENRMMPSPEQVKEFLGSGIEGPIVMVNLLKFRERAAYPDGRDADLSGAEAYARYGEGVRPLLEACGGRIRFSGAVAGLLLGRAEPLWDMVALAEWPSPQVMVKVTSSEAYREIAVHRDAGLEGQLNLTTLPLAGAGPPVAP